MRNWKRWLYETIDSIPALIIVAALIGSFMYILMPGCDSFVMVNVKSKHKCQCENCVCAECQCVPDSPCTCTECPKVEATPK